MARIYSQEVLEIMNTTLTEEEIEPYIESANVLVTDVLGSAGLSTSALKEIERWLTAHMIASSKDRQTKEETLGEASVKYSGLWGKGLEFTSYGQMVLMLDTSGKMSNLGKRPAKLRAIKSFSDDS